MEKEQILREILTELQNIQARCFGRHMTFEVTIRHGYFNVYIMNNRSADGKDYNLHSFSFYEFYSEERLYEMLKQIKAIPIVHMCL